MAQLVKVIKYFDDGTETVHEFVPNPNAAEIEAKVAEAMMPPAESEVTASAPTPDLGEVTSSENVEKVPKSRKKKAESEE